MTYHLFPASRREHPSFPLRRSRLVKLFSRARLLPSAKAVPSFCLSYIHILIFFPRNTIPSSSLIEALG